MKVRAMGTEDDEKQQLMHANPPSLPQLYPWLVICHGMCRQRQTFYSISEDRYYARIIRDMRNKDTCCCYLGWWVLEDYSSEDCFLWDPISMEKVQLPPLNISYDFCILSWPPSDPNCRVIFMNGKHRYFVSCQPGDDKFVKRDLVLEEQVLISGTTFEGKFYGLTLPTYTLVVADFSDPTLEFRQLIGGESLGQSLSTNECASNLIESCGELIFVYMRYLDGEAVSFKVFRADFSKMAWVKVKSIGERAIFLDLNQGISCSAAEFGVKGNSIYYTEYKDRNLYVFNLEDQSITMYLPCPNVSSRESKLHWVMIPVTNKS